MHIDPLPTRTIELVLQYIIGLSDPLPPHLISNPLLQRHHFLQLSTSSPVEYLCWPSPDRDKAIDILSRLHPLSDTSNFLTRYTSDSESTFAHVQISSDTPGLRMLFYWDDIHGWKYHDLRLMPFPSLSYSSPQDSLPSKSACELPRPPSLEADHISSGDYDPYWDAYAAAGHDSSSPPFPPQNRTDNLVGEDAYWAQYASVQGSADSTVPSPLPTRGKRQPANSTDDESALPFISHSDPIINIPVDAIHSLRTTSRREPPSPNTLARLLSMMSPREEVKSSSPDGSYSLQSPLAFIVDPSPEQTTVDSELVTPPPLNGYLDASIVSPIGVEHHTKYCLRKQAEDTALTHSIKGIYYLWKAGRKGEPDEKDRIAFLQIVRAAIACE